MTDYSPAGVAARADLARRTLAELDAAPEGDDDDRIAARSMRDRLQLTLDLDAAGESLRDLRILYSPLQLTRQVFDLMPFDTDEQWAIAAERMSHVRDALAGYTELLRAGVAAG